VVVGVVGAIAAGVAVASADGISAESPSPALLSILAVLRRPATPADQLPGWVATDVERRSEVFVKYVRRAVVADGWTFYVVPEIRQSLLGGPPRAGAGLVAVGKGQAGGGGPATVAEIKQDELTGTLGGGVPPTIVEGIVPDGVASITLHYPAGKAGGFSHKMLPAATVTADAVNNVIVVAAPRGGLQAGVALATWRATNGTILKRVQGTIRSPWWRPKPAP
jgi:hypothetical protein